MAADTADSHDDAQRTLERKALRNVRNLVEKLEEEGRAQSRLTLRFVVGIVALALVIAFVTYLTLAGRSTRQAPVTSPAKTAPGPRGG